MLTIIALSAIPQSVCAYNVRGTVTDTDGAPIEWAMVTVDNKLSAVSDYSGALEMVIADSVKQYEASISAVGMRTIRKVLTDKDTAFTITMPYDDSSVMDELVVTGYSTSRRRNVVGAMSSLSSLAQSSTAESGNVAEAIQGKLSGVTVSSSEGGPLSETSIVIRGGTSITGNNAPLYVVDGIVANSIDDIASSDIERIDILKDASSAAIYGARAAGGVVLITTKTSTSKHAKDHFTYQSEYGVRKFTHRQRSRVSTLTPSDYITLAYEQAAMKGGDVFQHFVNQYGDYASLSRYSGNGINWIDKVFGRTAFFMTQSATFTHAKDHNSIKINYEYDKANGTMIGSSAARHFFNSCVRLYDGKRITFDIHLGFTRRTTVGAGTSTDGSNTNARLRNALLYNPIGLAITDDESYEQSSSVYNPIEVTKADYRETTTSKPKGHATLTYKLNSFLSLSSTVSLCGAFTGTDRAYGLATSQARSNGNAPLASILNASERSFRNSNLLRIEPTFATDIHHIDVVIGEEYSKDKSHYSIAESKFFPTYLTAEEILANMSLGTAQPNVSYQNPDECMLSYFAKADYRLHDRYLLTATMRADKSNKFAQGHQWGFFPSVGAAWKFYAEKWAQPLHWLANGKLRASIGLSGNNRIADNLYENAYTAPSQTDPELNFNHTYQSYIKGVDYKANPDLTWESTLSQNVGLDLAFLHGKIEFIAEAYKSNTRDLLLQVELDDASGYDYMMQNVGETQNRGFELDIVAHPIKRKDFELTIAANIAVNRNKVLNLGGTSEIKMTSGWAGTEIKEDYLLRVGREVGLIYGYETDGIYRVEDFEYIDGEYHLREGVVSDAELLATPLMPGMLKLRDRNGDGIIDEEDKTVIGSTAPKHIGGFSVSARIKQFDVTADFNWSYGGNVLNANKIESTTTNKYSYRNMTSETLDRWTYIDASGNVITDPDALTSANQNAYMWTPLMNRYVCHSWAVEDGSYLRLQKLTLGYTFPDRAAYRMHLQKLRIYASASDLLCWTKYSGFDPEVNVRRTTCATPNVDYSAYPRSAAFCFGLVANF